MTNLNGGTAATNLTAMIAIMRNFRPSLLAPMQAFKRQYVINYRRQRFQGQDF